MPFFKTKLREVSKQLYLENGWKMPRGLMDSKERDPRNTQSETASPASPARTKSLSPQDRLAALRETPSTKPLPQSHSLETPQERLERLQRGDRNRDREPDLER